MINVKNTGAMVKIKMIMTVTINAITTISWLAALSFDTATAAGKKFRKSSKSHKHIIKKCPPTIYWDRKVESLNTQLFNSGPPALGNQLCEPNPSGIPGLQFCSGDRGKHTLFAYALHCINMK